ncbi:(Fe-S)-binding protein [bacterium]|nr:(Fe-S)-binding protein [bacterium]
MYIQRMALNPILERHKGELDKCVTCAICQSVCPTFQLSGLEKLSPRGRIVLLRRIVNGDVDPSTVADDTFNYCTLCYACQTACPAGVKTDLLFIGARQEIAASKGLPKAKQKVFAALESPDRVEKAVRLGSLAQKTLGEGTVNKLAGGMVVPKLRGKPWLKELPEVIEPEGGKVRATVAFFAGCMSNYVDARAAYASLEVLRRLGARIIIPKAQVCCGAPAFNNGDFGTAAKLAATNLALFEDPKITAVISPDATCGGAFKHEIPELLWDDDELAVSAQLVAAKTMDWAGFVLKHLDPRFEPTKEPAVKVTIHDSCHLTHTQPHAAAGIPGSQVFSPDHLDQDQPETGGSSRLASKSGHTQDNPAPAKPHLSVHKLLAKLQGVELVALPESTVCCGFGGSFSAMYPDDAARWGGRKLDSIGNTGAEIGIVSSPGCLNHLETVRSDRHENAYRLMHPAELICERYGWTPGW